MDTRKQISPDVAAQLLKEIKIHINNEIALLQNKDADANFLFTQKMLFAGFGIFTSAMTIHAYYCGKNVINEANQALESLYNCATVFCHGKDISQQIAVFTNHQTIAYRLPYIGSFASFLCFGSSGVMQAALTQKKNQAREQILQQPFSRLSFSSQNPACQQLIERLCRGNNFTVATVLLKIENLTLPRGKKARRLFNASHPAKSQPHAPAVHARRP